MDFVFCADGDKTDCVFRVSKSDFLFLFPVSYTHLDVYKRQLLACETAPGMTMVKFSEADFSLNLLKNKGRNLKFC